MAFSKTRSKSIQIKHTTDEKLLKIISQIKENEGIELRSRDQVIDTLASRFLRDD